MTCKFDLLWKLERACYSLSEVGVFSWTSTSLSFKLDLKQVSYPWSEWLKDVNGKISPQNVAW